RSTAKSPGPQPSKGETQPRRDDVSLRVIRINRRIDRLEAVAGQKTQTFRRRKFPFKPDACCLLYVDAILREHGKSRLIGISHYRIAGMKREIFAQLPAQEKAAAGTRKTAGRRRPVHQAIFKPCPELPVIRKLIGKA